MTYHMVNNTSRAVTCIAKPSPYWYGVFYKLIKHLALVFDVLSDKKDIARDLRTLAPIATAHLSCARYT